MQYALYVTGYSRGDLVALYPVETPAETVQEEAARESAAKVDVVSAGVERRVKVAAVLKNEEKLVAAQPLVTTPPIVWWDEGLAKEMGVPPDFANAEEARARFSNWVSSFHCIKSTRWRTVETRVSRPDKPEPHPIGVALEVQLNENCIKAWEDPDEWIRVAYARSLTRKLAQMVIVSSYYRKFDKPLPTDMMSAGAPLPPSGDDWPSLAVRFEREQIQQPPVVVETPLNVPSSGVEREGTVKTEFKALYEQYIHAGYPTQQALEFVRRYGEGWLASQQPAPVSKRSRLSADARHKLNVKTREKRKRKMRELTQLSQKTPRISPLSRM